MMTALLSPVLLSRSSLTVTVQMTSSSLAKNSPSRVSEVSESGLLSTV